MVEVFAKIGLINCLIAVYLGVRILLKNHKDTANRAFGLLALSISFWSFGYWKWLSLDGDNTVLFWIKLFTLGSSLIPFFYFYWIVSLLGLNKRYSKINATLFILCFALIETTFFTNLVINGYRTKMIFPYWPIAGVLYVFYICLFYVGLVSWALIILTKQYAHTNDRQVKSQIKYIFIGSLIGFSGGITNFFLWYNIYFPPYLNFLVSAGLLIFYYAASTHNLFKTKAILTEFFADLLWMTLAIKTIFSTSAENFFIDGSVTVLVTFLSFLVVKSTKKEVEQKEQLQVLTARLSEANEQLKALDKARAEFISIASHQLRTPPATVKWYLSSIIAGDYGQMDPQAKEALTKAERANNLLISLVEDMLNVSRIERGKMEFLFEPVDVIEMAEVTFEQLEPLAQEKKQQITFECPQTVLPKINADKEKLRQVMNNMIDNSIKYTEQGGKIIVRLEQVGDEIKFSVRDNGKGMDSEEIKEIFEKYKRGKESIKHSAGLGLGLYVARIIIEQHKGKIWAESAGPGKGSTFIFTLPIHSGLKETTLVDFAQAN